MLKKHHYKNDDVGLKDVKDCSTSLLTRSVTSSGNFDEKRIPQSGIYFLYNTAILGMFLLCSFPILH
jgi:hypothetical protein